MTQIAPVTLSEYDPAWVEKFEEEKARINSAVKGSITIEHIGSTAIPGMTAKPEIDILLGVKNLSQSPAIIQSLEKLDFVYFKRFEEFEPERRYLRKSDGIIPLVHIHMVEQGSPFWKERIILRDYLRSHPAVAQKYSAIKKECLERHGDDRQTYSKAKEELIVEMLRDAERANCA